MQGGVPEGVWKKAIMVKLLILDVDGVLTDGRIIMDHKGRELKAFDVRDGHGIKLLLQGGIEVAMLTGRSSAVVQKRAEDLGVQRVRQGVHDKVEAYLEIAQEVGIRDEEACFVGDDLVDIPLLKRVGLPIVVADGAEEAKRFALYVTKSSGGRGAVREACDLLMQAQGKWEEILRRYS
ncbi:MAG: HAD-IIIA family hydrolase [Deltaproteobacteria bacterium]|nr:HAD-IIIA family hydrolase [Deltaproteobacteria bacterium]